MASAIKSALPSHLKPNNGKEDGEASFERRHGKTRSHMVSRPFPPTPLLFCCCRVRARTVACLDVFAGSCSATEPARTWVAFMTPAGRWPFFRSCGCGRNSAPLSTELGAISNVVRLVAHNLPEAVRQSACQWQSKAQMATVGNNQSLIHSLIPTYIIFLVPTVGPFQRALFFDPFRALFLHPFFFSFLTENTTVPITSN